MWYTYDLWEVKFRVHIWDSVQDGAESRSTVEYVDVMRLCGRTLAHTLGPCNPVIAQLSVAHLPELPRQDETSRTKEGETHQLYRGRPPSGPKTLPPRYALLQLLHNLIALSHPRSFVRWLGLGHSTINIDFGRRPSLVRRRLTTRRRQCGSLGPLGLEDSLQRNKAERVICPVAVHCIPSRSERTLSVFASFAIWLSSLL